MKNSQSSNSQRVGGTKVSREVSTLKRQLHGAVLKLGSDPPNVVLNPWISLVAEIAVSESSTVTIGSLVSQVLTQTGNDVVDMRVVAVKVWGGVGNSLKVDIFDPTAADKNLQHLTDRASGTDRSRVGYLYPERVSSTICSSTSTNKVFNSVMETQSTAGSSSFFGTGVARVAVLYRCKN